MAVPRKKVKYSKPPTAPPSHDSEKSLDEKNGESGIRSAEPISKSASASRRSPSTPAVPDDLLMVQATFKSSLFRLQVTELLKEVSVDYSKTKAIESTLFELKGLLDAIDDKLSSAPGDSFFKSLFAMGEKTDLQFQKPTSVDVVGSYLLQTVTKPLQNIDLTVEIPKACLLEKDFLNHRYHYKRVLYLKTIGTFLQQSGKFEKVEWSCLCHDIRKPVLIITPSSESGTPFVIRILASVSWDTFDLSKLVPSRNNVREAKTKDGVATPTPHYNASILEDMAFKDVQKWLHARLANNSSLKEAVILLKVWARKLNYDQSVDSFSGFLLSLLAAHLSTPAGSNRINPQMTCYQIFRVVMDAICQDKFLSKGVFLQHEDGKPNGLPSEGRLGMSKAFAAVICDPFGRLNFAHRVTKSAISELKEDAQLTLAALQNKKIDSFNSVFMTKVDFAAKFDFHARLSNFDNKAEEGPLPASFKDESATKQGESRMENVLSKAMGDRAHYVRVLPRQFPDRWGFDQVPKTDASSVLVGIKVSEPDVAFRVVEVGPSADNTVEAKKFRAFWGSKAELRRFKDGSIAESVVWSTPPGARHLIIEQILAHVADRHLGIKGGDVWLCAGKLDWPLGKDTMAAYNSLSEAFEKLSKALRTLQGIPLSVVGVQPLSTELSHMAVCYDEPQVQSSSNRTSTGSMGSSPMNPIDIAIQLEGSGKWPDDPTARQMTKLAFCLKIAGSLEKSYGATVMSSESEVILLIFGHAFRLSVLHDKDPSSLSGVAAISPRQDLLLRSTHASMMQSLHTDFPLLSPTVRLAKRWAAAHLFSTVLSHEALELLVAACFCHPLPFSEPRSRLAGFLRFLRQLAHHDWKNEPLIVDLNNSLSEEDCRDIQEKFEARLASHQAKESQHSVMAIATPYDREGHVWTAAIDRKVLNRLAAFARSSAGCATAIAGCIEDSSKSLFCTPFSMFDAVLLLSEASHPLFSNKEIIRLSSLGGNDIGRVLPARKSSQALPAGTPGGEPLIGFDPVRVLITELESRFGFVAEFNADMVSRNVIGVFWRKLSPDLVKNSAVQLYVVGKHFSKKRKVEVTDSGKAPGLNIEAILDDILTVGGGIIQQIKINR